MCASDKYIWDSPLFCPLLKSWAVVTTRFPQSAILSSLLLCPEYSIRECACGSSVSIEHLPLFTSNRCFRSRDAVNHPQGQWKKCQKTREIYKHPAPRHAMHDEYGIGKYGFVIIHSDLSQFSLTSLLVTIHCNGVLLRSIGPSIEAQYKRSIYR